jgi:hypothetical protein
LTFVTIFYYQKKGGVVTNLEYGIIMLKDKDNLSGRVFGQWSVSDKHRSNKNRDREWWSKCSCGFEKWVKAQYLKNNSSTKCVSCSTKRPGYPDTDIPNPLWKRINTNAAKRQIPISVTRKEVFDLFVAQHKKCALTGWELTMARNSTEHNAGNYTASLDRIDSTKGYVTENIQWVHKDVNLMKNTFSSEYLCQLCRAIITNVCEESFT